MVPARVLVTVPDHVPAQVLVVRPAGLLVLTLVNSVHVEEGKAAGGKVIEDLLVAPRAVPRDN